VNTPIQRAAAFVSAHAADLPNFVVVTSIVGSHAYSTAGPHSDVDIGGIHVAPTRSFLGCTPAPENVARVSKEDNIDYASEELGVAVRNLIRGSSHTLERLWSRNHNTVFRGRLYYELLDHANALLSRAIGNHYAGHAKGALEQFRKMVRAQAAYITPADLCPNVPTAKLALSTLRSSLIGLHIMRYGAIELNMTSLTNTFNDMFSGNVYNGVCDLINMRRCGEEELSKTAAERVVVWAEHALASLKDAQATSALPYAADAKAIAEVDEWLYYTRRELLDTNT
jgi:predicted nucleotidyltransferase